MGGGGARSTFRPAPCLLPRTFMPVLHTLHCRETTDSKLRAFFENFGKYRAFCQGLMSSSGHSCAPACRHHVGSCCFGCTAGSCTPCGALDNGLNAVLQAVSLRHL